MSNKPSPRPKTIGCAIYTRKSTEEGLDQQFNSLDAQREAAEAYIRSQKCEGWEIGYGRYDDGGFSGGNIERPALKRLMDLSARISRILANPEGPLFVLANHLRDWLQSGKYVGLPRLLDRCQSFVPSIRYLGGSVYSQVRPR